jgi:hypothetical protein
VAVRLVDYVRDLPDAEQISVQVPPIRVNGDGLFYLLNWFTSIGAPEGPGGFVMHLPHGASEPLRLAFVDGGGSGGRHGLAVTQTAAIFSEAPDGVESQGAVLSVSPGGGEPTMLAVTSGLAGALVTDEKNVYFVDREGTKSVPLAGGPVRTLTSQTVISIMVAGATLYLGDYRTPGSLSSVPIEGGPVTVLVTESALQPVLCGESVCWFTGPALDMRLRQLVPGGSPTTLATGLSQAHDVVFDGQYFFVTTGRGALERIPAAGGTPALSQAGGSGLALDDECLYWSDFPGIYAWALSAARK